MSVMLFRIDVRFNSCCYKYFRAIDRRTLWMSKNKGNPWFAEAVSREENASGPRHGDVGRPIPPWNRRTIFPTRTELTPRRRISHRGLGARERPTKEKAAAAKYFLFFYHRNQGHQESARGGEDWPSPRFSCAEYRAPVSPPLLSSSHMACKQC